MVQNLPHPRFPGKAFRHPAVFYGVQNSRHVWAGFDPAGDDLAAFEGELGDRPAGQRGNAVAGEEQAVDMVQQQGLLLV